MNRIDDEQSLGFMETKILNPSSSYLSFGKGRADDTLNDHTISDEDEPTFMVDGNDDPSPNPNSRGRKASGSGWQRMKWSDNRVRLLIQVVACVGDDGSLDTIQGGGDGGRGPGCLQKKGKWKTVSKIMVSKGCQVSPQQCEDKFNDLNKRYKRLNDILGKGTSCRVVENPAIMDSMPRLSAKTKEDVKKILNSKHLFYPEMCAYHNGQRIPNCRDLDLLASGEISKEQNGSSGEGESEESESEDEVQERGLGEEMKRVFEDPQLTVVERREWVGKRRLELEERRVGIEAEALEMEKRRFKWERFCDRKDREMEVSRLESERLMLENQRMAFQLKHTDQVMESE